MIPLVSGRGERNGRQQQQENQARSEYARHWRTIYGPLLECDSNRTSWEVVSSGVQSAAQFDETFAGPDLSEGSCHGTSRVRPTLRVLRRTSIAPIRASSAAPPMSNPGLRGCSSKNCRGDAQECLDLVRRVPPRL
jgi:hypothetical protein